MLGYCIAALLALTPPTDGSAKTSPPAAPNREAAFEPLFDGVSLKGWKVFAPEGDGASTWSVKDRTMICAGQPIGYIATERTFESFELTLEWRFDPAKGAGNSGVLLRVAEKDEVWPRSIEAQLHSENAGDIWNIGAVPMKPSAERTEGRRTKKEHPTNEKPLGEWNRYRIVLDGSRLELYVNDLLQNVAIDVEVKRGRIALQSEGAHIEFRSIAIREIPAKPAAR